MENNSGQKAPADNDDWDWDGDGRAGPSAKNTSGQGNAAVVPAEIRGWNWGAFLLNWIWGLGNQTYIALLMFVPFVGFVMPFVLGAKGNEWAWRNKQWKNVEQFRASQRRWAVWGAVIWVVSIALCLSLVLVIVQSFKSSDAFTLAVKKLESDERAVQLLGRPISTGFPMGNVEVSGPYGKANLSFSVKGPSDRGTAYVEASKELGQWTIRRMVIEQQGTGHRITLAP